MILGHFFLAFTAAALIGIGLGYERDHALYLAAFAGCFAVIPDVDMIYGIQGLLVALESGLHGFPGTFWNVSNRVHRGLSHSLVTGVVATLGFTFYFIRSKMSTATLVSAIFTLSALVFENLIGAVVMLVFSIIGLKITDIAREYINIDQFVSATALGLLLHPFGDLFTGTPPDLLFPIMNGLIENKIVFSQDPVLNFVSIFGLELSLAFTAFYLALYLRVIPVRENVSPMVSLGFLYAFAFYLIPAPTLASSYTFVFSILAAGALPQLIFQRPSYSVDSLLISGLNYTLTVTVAFFTYLAFYLVI